MRSLPRLLAATVVTAGAAGCAVPEGGPGPLDIAADGPTPVAGRRLGTDQLQEITGAGAYAWTTRSGAQGTVDYRPQGDARLGWRMAERRGETAGRWRIDGDTLCTAWRDMREGRERCLYVYEVAPGTYRTVVPRTGAMVTEFTPVR